MRSQDPDNHTNLLLAVVLSMAVLLIWQILFPPPEPVRSPQTTVEATADGAPAKATRDAGAMKGQGAEGTGGEVGPRVAIKTASIEGSISLKAHASMTCNLSITTRLRIRRARRSFFCGHRIPSGPTLWSMAGWHPAGPRCRIATRSGRHQKVQV